MMRKAFRFYVDSFQGLSREVWLLAFITFINRAGTMVLPFLSLYLKDDMGLSLKNVGWVMSAFGAGSVAGSYLGGKLTDRIGYYRVITGSLFFSGFAFIGLQYVHGFIPFCIGVFTLTLFADTFRPALFVALRAYSKPENRTRGVTLVRLAINLGFSMGPAIGGALIAGVGYVGLFRVDGITCFVAVILFMALLSSKNHVLPETDYVAEADRSPYSDKIYLFFLLIIVLITIPFLQYFSTIPIYYSEVFNMSEAQIGMLLGLNGLLIFLLEMPLIKWCEAKGFSMFSILVISVLLFALSFIVLDVAPIVLWLWVGMVFMTVGEMLNFPFMNRFAMDRSDQGAPGAYMALFTISWSIAHIIGHNLGLQLLDSIGYRLTWLVFLTMLIVATLMLNVLKRMIVKEAKSLSNQTGR